MGFSLCGCSVPLPICVHYVAVLSVVSFYVFFSGKAFSAGDDLGQKRVTKLMDIAYQGAKKDIAFARFKDIIELEARHGVDLDSRYKNDKMCRD